jgi:hypothetical protein
MNKDRVKGTIDEAAGTVKQKTGELTRQLPTPDQRHLSAGQGQD